MLYAVLRSTTVVFNRDGFRLTQGLCERHAAMGSAGSQ